MEAPACSVDRYYLPDCAEMSAEISPSFGRFWRAELQKYTGPFKRSNCVEATDSWTDVMYTCLNTLAVLVQQKKFVTQKLLHY